tara:strand:- start:99 stop:905 length:807 start_codon:yes stop_codon:yes gene_type:complete
MKLSSLLVTLVLLLLTQFLYAQKHQFIVLERNSNSPVSFATIILRDTIFYANPDGLFSHNNIVGESIFISCVGYHDTTVIVRSNRDTVFLTPKIEQLEVYEVKSSYSTIEKGYYDFKMNSSLGIHEDLYNVVFIEGEQRNAMLETVFFNFKKIKKGTCIQVYLFEVKEGGVPGKLLSCVAYSHYKITDKVEVDLRSNGIVVPPEGIFVGYGLCSGQLQKQEDLFLKINTLNNVPVRTFGYNKNSNKWINNQDYGFNYFPAIGIRIKPY